MAPEMCMALSCTEKPAGSGALEGGPAAAPLPGQELLCLGRAGLLHRLGESLCVEVVLGQLPVATDMPGHVLFL